MSFETLCIIATQMSSCVIVTKRDNNYTVMLENCKIDYGENNTVPAAGIGKTLDEAADFLADAAEKNALIFNGECSVNTDSLIQQVSKFSINVPIGKIDYFDALLEHKFAKMVDVCVRHDNKGNYVVFLNPCIIENPVFPGNMPYGFAEKLNNAAKSLLRQIRGETLLKEFS